MIRQRTARRMGGAKRYPSIGYTITSASRIDLLMGVDSLDRVFAMSLAPIAPLAALRESSVVFGALIGHFILKERLGVKRALATALVVIGIGVLQLSRAMA